MCDDEPDLDDEPCGSCDNCGCDIYPDEDCDGLCDQCSWWESLFCEYE